MAVEGCLDNIRQARHLFLSIYSSQTVQYHNACAARDAKRIYLYHTEHHWREVHNQHVRKTTLKKENAMTESVYKIIELVGSSPVSWEEATQNAVKSAGMSLRDLRIAEVVTLDMKLENDQPAVFRARVKLSFKLLSD
jgi:dodecin